ncbi:hypothetical protein TrVFT333_005154 [Trichoderma virens FT-333]|nr:hypothetical protein TrVFT333_005154 [Trichoderma virens FT-333]
MATPSETNSSKPDQSEDISEVDIAQACEATATYMEAALTKLEAKLDSILADFEEMERERKANGTDKANEEEKEADK